MFNFYNCIIVNIAYFLDTDFAWELNCLKEFYLIIWNIKNNINYSKWRRPWQQFEIFEYH